VNSTNLLNFYSPAVRRTSTVVRNSNKF